MTAKDLKNALLQEAVQGKLVPQIAGEGNASIVATVETGYTFNAWTQSPENLTIANANNASNSLELLSTWSASSSKSLSFERLSR